MFKRLIEEKIEKYIKGKDNKTFYIWGPRRSGKTTILQKLAKELGVRVFNFDFSSDQSFFTPKRDALDKLIRDNKIILIDEIQNYPQATVVLKLLHDEYKVKVIATGSSELRQKVKEFDTQAGRFTEHYCLPFSLEEIKTNSNLPSYEEEVFEKKLQEELQVFGSYPEVYATRGLTDEAKTRLLENIVQTYVLKDTVDIYGLKNKKLAEDILTKIALQLGSEVSIREIAASLGSNGGTVDNYIILEIEKQRKNTEVLRNLYFYREYGGREVDLVIEDYRKNYHCVEIKVQGKGGNKDIFPLHHAFTTIHKNNYFEKISYVLGGN